MAGADVLGSVASALGLVQLFYRFTGARREMKTDHELCDHNSNFLLHLDRDLETGTGRLSGKRKKLIGGHIKYLDNLLKEAKHAAGEKEAKGIVQRLLRVWQWVFKDKEAAQMSKDAALHGYLMLLTNMTWAVLENIPQFCGRDIVPLELYS